MGPTLTRVDGPQFPCPLHRQRDAGVTFQFSTICTATHLYPVYDEIDNYMLVLLQYNNRTPAVCHYIHGPWKKRMNERMHYQAQTVARPPAAVRFVPLFCNSTKLECRHPDVIHVYCCSWQACPLTMEMWQCRLELCTLTPVLLCWSRRGRSTKGF